MADAPGDPKLKAAEAKDKSGFVPVNPFEIVVFGGTGDLARRKLIPALYHRFLDGQFDDSSKILGVSRSKLSREEYLAVITRSYKEFSLTTIWAKKRFKTYLSCALPISCLSRFGRANILTIFRSRPPNLSALPAAKPIIINPARCAIWCKTICFSCYA